MGYIKCDIEVQLNSAVDDLDQLINLTETKYSLIYECLPNVESEVKLSIREVEILLGHLLFNLRALGDKDQSVVVRTLNLMVVGFERVTDSFISQEQIEILTGAFLDKSNSDGRNFTELVMVVGRVQEALSVLRDLALNSIIFSVRIGKPGAAFEILADRINMVSLELRSRFENMTDSIDRLKVWNESFTNNLSEFIIYEGNLKNSYQDKFRQEFEKVSGTLRVVCSIFENNLENAKGVLTGVGDIMVGIQNQDIIRQNAENLIKCLKVMQDKTGTLREESVEKSLDYLVFANKVLELSKILLDNLEKALDESLLDLAAKLSVIYDNASELEEDTRCLGRYFAGQVEGPKVGNLLDTVFDLVLGLVDELRGIKGQIESRGDSLLEGYDSFVQLLTRVEKDFEVINKEAKSLKKMKILIPIELARINLEGDSSINDFVNAVDEVISTVNANQQVFLNLRRFLSKNIAELKTALDFTRDRLDNSAIAISRFRVRLDTVRWLAVGAVQASGREMAEIFDQLKQPCQHLADRVFIGELITDARLKINKLHERTRELQEHILRNNGISHWEEKEDGLRALMEQFTCFVERKALTHVTGSEDWDIGTDGGDIVLF